MRHRLHPNRLSDCVKRELVHGTTPFVVKNGCATAQDDCRRCDVCTLELLLVRRAGEHPGADPGLDCGYPSAPQPVADTGDRTGATTGAISVA